MLFFQFLKIKFNILGKSLIPSGEKLDVMIDTILEYVKIKALSRNETLCHANLSMAYTEVWKHTRKARLALSQLFQAVGQVGNGQSGAD